MMVRNEHKGLIVNANCFWTLMMFLCFSFLAQAKDYAETWSSSKTISTNTEVNGNLKITSSLTIDADKTLTVYGDVDIEGYSAQHINGCLYIVGGNLTIDGKDGVLNFYLHTKGKVIVSDRREVDANYVVYEGTGNFTLISYSKSHYAVLRYDGGDLYVYNNFKQVDYATNSGSGTHTTITSSSSGKNSKIYVGGDYIIEESNKHPHQSDIIGNEAYLPSVYVFGVIDDKLSDSHKAKVNTNYNGITSVSALLPIELTSFTATATDYGFVFNWVTASEKENDYFTLEYSINGVDFSEIDYIHGAGTTSETSEYEYVWDDAPQIEMIYFRLKQTDYNGEYTYSDVIVSCRKKSAGATRTFRYGPLNLQVVDGELRYIENK